MRKPDNHEAVTARQRGTFAGIASQVAPDVTGYHGARSATDHARAIACGAWARRLAHHQRTRTPLPALVKLTQSELVGYFFARHQREAYRVFLQTPGVDLLRQLFPSAASILFNLCGD